ncbi:hypothetical protein RRG08_040390 [Elysia crispata]|uniref:Uncharacterized protein n=1 Tax=Elysia crispata TaxID=231223 RepID=A0AAE1A3N6_9GAST|nr:hypothetical protein RRG08_040390 [Elysia crispata]
MELETGRKTTSCWQPQTMKLTIPDFNNRWTMAACLGIFEVRVSWRCGSLGLLLMLISKGFINSGIFPPCSLRLAVIVDVLSPTIYGRFPFSVAAPALLAPLLNVSQTTRHWLVLHPKSLSHPRRKVFPTSFHAPCCLWLMQRWRVQLLPVPASTTGDQR